MKADINKGAESRNIINDAFKHHTFGDIFQFFYIRIKGCRDRFRTRIMAGFEQFGHNVAHRSLTDCLVFVTRQIERRNQRFRTDELVGSDPEVASHAIYYMITLRVNASIVKF